MALQNPRQCLELQKPVRRRSREGAEDRGGESRCSMSNPPRAPVLSVVTSPGAEPTSSRWAVKDTETNSYGT